MIKKILIDNGHGENTPGKRSPDGSFREFLYAREIAKEVVVRLRSRGYDAERLVKEYVDVPLHERARRVNEVCGKYGSRSVILVSIHCNAAGDGSRWMNAKGWSCYTSKGKTKADQLATCLCESAEKILDGKHIRKDLSDGDPDWEESFYLLTKTKCPAVLTENLFMDNREEVDYLLSSKGRNEIINVHVDGITKFVES